MKTLLITNSVFNRIEGESDSTAGSDVQLTIFESLYYNDNLRVDVLDCSQDGTIKFGDNYNAEIKGLNVSGYFRRLFPITVFKTLIYLFKKKPQLIVKYNLYIQQLIAVIIYRFIFNIKVIVIVQDYRKGTFFSLRQRVLDKVCIALLRFTDYCLPITDYISDLIPLSSLRKRTYSGGITKSCRNLKFDSNNVMKKQAVFAGYLSEYNGVSDIIKFWVENNIEIKLIIYGDGPLNSLVKNAAEENEYIIYKGKVNQKEVLEEIQSSNFYFCLRYSRGIDSNCFYPSKFFIGLYSSSVLLYNRFEGLLSDFNLDLPFVLNDDFSGLRELLHVDDAKIIKNFSEKQRKLLDDHQSWEEVLSQCIKKTTQL